MGDIKSYKDLVVWQKSISLAKTVYDVTHPFPGEEGYGLTQQLRRAAVSVSSNIAEGWGRNSTRNYIHFLRISRASLYELESQIILSCELNFCSQETVGSISKQAQEISKMLNSLIKSLNNKLETKESETLIP